MISRSRDLMERMEALLYPAPYRAGFRTIQRAGVFYTDRPGWDCLGVAATATSEEGARRNIDAMTDGVSDPRKTLIVWC